jgi:dienelactone hydrolase
MVDRTSPQLFTIKFKPSAADPATVSNDAEQTAYIDTRATTIRAKLVVTLSGTSNPPGPLGLASYAAGLGFHAFAVAYYNAYSPAQSDPDFFGQARFDEFDGMGRNKSFKVARPDSVEVRVARALTYLQAKNPQGDWAYYLNKDGQVRWSDVIFFGQSHGATSAAAFAKIRRVWRAVSMSGPRDTKPVVATWLTLPSATPIDRFYGFTGTGDGQHPDHLKAMEVMGYIGAVVDITQAKPPYGGSHRLQYNGSHTADLSCAPFVEPCQYMLGTLPP